MSPLSYAAVHWTRGDHVEVLRSGVSWFPATVLAPGTVNRSDKVYVEFKTLDDEDEESSGSGSDSRILRDYVNVADVRPVPPLELHRCFMVGEAVHVYFGKKGWRTGGEVVDNLVNSKYTVSFGEGKLIEDVNQWDARLHRVWENGSWVPPLQLQHSGSCFQKSSEMEVRPKKLKLKIKLSRQTLAMDFHEGMLVEVKTDEDGYQGAWYTAMITGAVGSNLYSVVYQTLLTEDESDLLRQDVNASCIRPCPPEIPRKDRFNHLEQVDAMFNDGWWEGLISKVLSDFQYEVYFWTTNEAMLFKHSQLRSHQEWVNGKWVPAYESSPNLKPTGLKLKIKCKEIKEVPKFRKGTEVEVKSDEEGYHGSWYTAVIIDFLNYDKYLVQYKYLRTDDESDFLEEKADASYVRPSPHKIQRIDRFKMLEEVDAWYNDGWWTGLICRILDGFKYSVYFWTTNEELEFRHFKLRPHQEWICGKWVFSSENESKSEVKPAVGNIKIPCDLVISLGSFSNGVKVEVNISEQYSEGLWFPAIVLCPLSNGKHLVEYMTLKTDAAAELLKEVADKSRIRPCPPVIQCADRFKPLEQVNAWYRGGWCVGQICKVFEGSKYTIYFGRTNEVLEFQHSSLRPHHDWIDGKWIKATTGQI